jgi:hypothetical protein
MPTPRIVYIHVPLSSPSQAEPGKWHGGDISSGYWSSHRQKDKFVVFEGMTVPYSFIEVKNSSCLTGKLRITRKNPRAISPRSNGILMEPTPDCAVTNRGHKTGLPNLSAQIGNTPACQRELMCYWQLTGKSFNLNDQVWGEKTWGDQVEDALRVPGDGLQRSVFATC